MSYFARFAAQLAVALVVLELLSRVVLGHKPALRYDKRYDRLSAPNQNVVEAQEGFSRGRTNELGNLDSPMPSPLPAHAILALGDSLTEARQVGHADRWPERLAALTQREVYNAGQRGWSPANALGYLQAEKQRFAPEYVVLQVSGNDIDDMVSEKRPHVVEGVEGLSLKVPKRGKSGMAAKINKAKELVSRSALGGNLITAGLTVLGAGNDGSGNALGCSPPTAFNTKAANWLLAQIRAEHAKTVVIYLPLLNYYEGCSDKCTGAAALFRNAAATAGLPFVDATAALCSSFAQTHQPLHGFWNSLPGVGHLNSEGNDVVAHVLADYFAGQKAAP